MLNEQTRVVKHENTYTNTKAFTIPILIASLLTAYYSQNMDSKCFSIYVFSSVQPLFVHLINSL